MESRQVSFLKMLIFIDDFTSNLTLDVVLPGVGSYIIL